MAKSRISLLEEKEQKEQNLTIDEMLDIATQYHFIPLEDLIQAILKKNPKALVIFDDRIKELSRQYDKLELDGRRNALRVNPVEYNHVLADIKAFYDGFLQLSEKLPSFDALSDEELLILGMMGDTLIKIAQKNNLNLAVPNYNREEIIAEIINRTSDEVDDTRIDVALLTYMANEYFQKYLQFTDRTEAEDKEWKKQGIRFSQRAIKLGAPKGWRELANWDTSSDPNFIMAADKGDPQSCLEVAVASMEEITSWSLANRYILKDLETSEKVEKAEAYFIKAITGGQVHLEGLKEIYMYKGLITNAAKCAALSEYFGDHEALSDLLNKHLDNPYVLLYGYHFHTRTNSANVILPTSFPKGELKKGFFELACNNLSEQKDELTEFDKLITGLPWGEYNFQVTSKSPRDDEIKSDTVYLYTSEEKPDYQFVYLISRGRHLHDENSIAYHLQSHGYGAMTVLIAHADSFSVYGNTDGTTWKITGLSGSYDALVAGFQEGMIIPFDMVPPALYQDISTKKAHTPSFGYAIKNQAGEIKRDNVKEENMLQSEHFPVFIRAIKTLSCAELVCEHKENILDYISRQGVIPRARVYSLLASDRTLIQLINTASIENNKVIFKHELAAFPKDVIIKKISGLADKNYHYISPSVTTQLLKILEEFPNPKISYDDLKSLYIYNFRKGNIEDRSLFGSIHDPMSGSRLNEMLLSLFKDIDYDIKEAYLIKLLNRNGYDEKALDYSLAKLIHHKKLLQIARAEFDIEKLTASSITTEITRLVSNLSPKERKQVQLLKAKMQNVKEELAQKKLGIFANKEEKLSSKTTTPLPKPRK